MIQTSTVVHYDEDVSPQEIEAAVEKAKELEPAHDWVVGRKLPWKMERGLYIPQNAYNEFPEVEVLRVGPGRVCEVDGSLMPMFCRVGDVVKLFGHIVRLDEKVGIITFRDQHVLHAVSRRAQ